MTRIRVALVGLLSIFAAVPALAQGSLSVQGFGYPPGQVSTRAEGMGGAVGELDAFSQLNPASIAGARVTALYLQYDPEFRTVTSGAATSRTTTARFPIVSLILPMGSRWTLGAGSSTLVDRSSLTRATRKRQIESDSVTVNTSARVLGAIDDVRLALGYTASPNLRLGLGAHLITGTNLLTLVERFPDSARYTNISEQSRLSYTGTAASIGMEWHPSKLLGLGLSGRRGGTMRAESGDTLVAQAKAPDHYGASLEYSGWGDTNIGFRVARDQWSSMRALASSSVTTYDAWDISIGAEEAGLHLASRPMMLRAGIRSRTLPFSTTGSGVRELSIAGGFGLEMARGRASLDVTLQHASRTSSSSVKERAYILSLGLRVTP